MPAAARLLPGVFYGWVIVAAAGLVSFVTVGIGFYGQTFLLDGLRSAHGWPLAQLAGASSVFFVVSAIASPIVGWRIDRDGPTAYFIVGGCLLAASLAVVGWLDDPWQLYWVYPWMALGFTMSSLYALIRIVGPL